MNLTGQVLLVIFVLLVFEVGLLACLGLLLKHAEEQTDHERKVVETIDHLERLSMLREKATSGLLQEQLFFKDDRNSARNKETFGQYVEQIPVEMNKIIDMVQDDPDVASNAKKLQQVLLFGTKEMVFERDLYLSGEDDSVHVAALNRASNLAAQLTRTILDHYKTLEQNAKRKEAESRATLQTAFVVAIILNIVYALALGSLFIGSIIKRLNIVTENSKKLAAGIPLNAPISGGDEIATLDHVFHQMAEALAEAAHKERAIIENAVDVICSMDKRLRFEEVNPACTAILGYEPDELIGKNMLNIVAPDRVEDTRLKFENIMQDGAKAEFETLLVTKSGADGCSLFGAMVGTRRCNILRTARHLASKGNGPTEARIRRDGQP